MWATFNVPLEGQGEWGLLPLVAGVAIMRALRGYAIPGLRLRWPNDVLVGRAKLAGILVERPLPTLGSIGIGLNMHNDVCSLALRVQDPPARLADLVPDCPPVPVFTAILAEAIRSAFTDFTDGGFSALEEELQAAWGSPRPVLAHTDSGLITGSFLGILPDGSPRLAQADGRVIAVPALAINRLQEA